MYGVREHGRVLTGPQLVGYATRERCGQTTRDSESANANSQNGTRLDEVGMAHTCSSCFRSTIHMVLDSGPRARKTLCQDLRARGPLSKTTPIVD